VEVFLGSFGGAVAFAAFAWTAYVVAVRAAGAAASAAERACAAAIAATWLLVAAFLALAPVHAFRLVVVVPLSLALAIAAHRALGRDGVAARLARSDVDRSRALLAFALAGRWRWLVVPAALLTAAKVLRGLVAPPLGWDALTYHLVKAGLWVQSGGDASFRAPDAWGYYRFFAPHGDILWAWAMLPVRGDVLLGPAGLAVWLACAVGSHASARALGAERTAAGLAALAIAFTPAVFNAMTIAYVDNTVLALFLLGAPFAIRFVSSPRAADALLASAAFGLAAGTKSNALPLLALWGAVVVVRAARRDVAPQVRFAALAGSALAAAVALPPYVEAWIHAGSPLYPLSVSLAGRTLWSGNPELAALESGALFPDEHVAVGRIVHALLASRLPEGRQHMGLGPGSTLIVLLGLAGAAMAWRRRVGRAPALILVTMGASVVAAAATPGMRSLWTTWAYSSPRLVTPLLAALAIVGAIAPGRAARAIRVAAVAAGLALCLPLWRALDVAAVARLGAWVVAFLAAGAVVVGATRYRPPRLRARVRALAALSLAAAFVIPLASVRRATRPRYHRAAAEGIAYDLYPLSRAYAACWPLWERFDDGVPHRLAVTAGWDGMGHNWYVYPLFGSRLQNRIDYVAPTRDGSVIDYREADALEARANAAAWVSLLLEREIEFVIALPPPSMEATWMEGMVDVFEPVAIGGEAAGRAYRFDRERARALLSGAR